MTWLAQSWTLRLVAACLPSLVCSGADNLNDTILLKDGLVFVDTIINGHGPFRMLVDTGTTTTLLAPDAALEAQLECDHRVLLTALGVQKLLPATSTGDLSFGAARASGLEIAIAPIGQVQRIHPGTDGILGQNFLGRSAYLIDYVRKKLWLGADATRRADELPFMLVARQTNGRTILPVTLQAGGPGVSPWTAARAA